MLVIDTDNGRDFLEVIGRMSPSDTAKIVRFVLDVIDTLKATENRVKTKEIEIECLLKSLDELEVKDNGET